MNNQRKFILGVAAGVALGGILTAQILKLQGSDEMDMSGNSSQSGEEPLYWVAPMDPDYRSDKPGLSPMGMELIPVYAEEQLASGPGTISISPQVVNNIGVRTGHVTYQAINTEINTVGYVDYDQDQLFHVHARMAGWIEKLYVTAEGAPVQAGQPLYDLYSPELVAAQEELLLAVSRNNATLIQGAERRLQALQVPQQSIDRIKSQGEVQQFVTFRSPSTGFVDNLNIREGFYVTPANTLMSVGALNQVWVEAEVFERQSALVKVGQSVSMQLDYLPGRIWNGQVDYLYPTLDPTTRTARVRLRFDNEDMSLKPNMFANIRIVAESPNQSLTIPREALIRTGTQDRVVLALGEGRFKSIEVEVGRIDTQRVEILSGLTEGEEIVTSAQFLLDSESSKSSDFMRMNYDTDEMSEVPTEAMPEMDHSGMDHSQMIHGE
jgi:membrane fusion protein, copper/silver efflux system